MATANATSPKHGEYLTARDVKERLIQDADAITFLLWPPNLFAFTSYTFSLSGAYQLVVSPPPGQERDLYHWPPKRSLIEKLFFRLNELGSRGTTSFDLSPGIALSDELDFSEYIVQVINQTPDVPKEALWTYLVRKCALEWRKKFDDMKPPRWLRYREQIPMALSPALNFKRTRTVRQFVPPFLLACWTLFERLYLDESKHDIASLLCNGVDFEYHGIDRMDAWLATVALLTMHAIADDTCVGWGILREPSLTIEFPRLAFIDSLRDSERREAWLNEKRLERFPEAIVRNDSAPQRAAAQYLSESGTMATISPARARVLPKRHNPDVGITLRSISSNLAFHHSSIDVVWKRNDDSRLARLFPSHSSDARLRQRAKPGVFTILLLPFPMHVHTKDFRALPDHDAHDVLDNREGYGFFEYFQRRPPQAQDITDVIKEALLEEEKGVDVIVLPEAAINEAVLQDLIRDLPELARQHPPAVSLLIAGVSEKEEGARFKRNNSVHYRYWNGETYDEGGDQHKHHRWQLDRSQIHQYGLSQTLDPKIKWWEAINVDRRRVSFVNMGDALTVCPLICEDLARQDPIADLIRQVGPSLVVSILMDGPQHKDRWSSRYAAILAEDPGSSVLALTSFGMMRRWNTKYARLSRVVALWNDKEGSREIELQQGAKGILLSLRIESEPEVIADGRLEIFPTSKITLADIIQIHPPRSVVDTA